MSNNIKFVFEANLFAGVSRNALQRLISRSEICSFTRGETIFSAGDIGDHAYLILSGEISVLLDMEWGQREFVRRGVGDLVGEMALLSQECRTATVRTNEPTECLVMARDAIDELIDAEPAFARTLLRTLSQRLQQSDAQSTKELISGQKALIFALADLAESRDKVTGEHLKRVRHYSAILAKCLTDLPEFSTIIDDVFVDRIYFAAPLHDIGKVAIEDSILRKPGKLTDAEFRTMQSHCVRGSETFQPVLEGSSYNDTFSMVYNIIRHHHEHWDGNGYPDGLSGNDIPLEARIMAIVDVYDALLSQRSYKAAMTLKKVEEILREGSGTQFDPKILQVMLDNFEKFQGEECHSFRNI